MHERGSSAEPAAVEKTDIHPQRVLAVAGSILATLLVAGLAIAALLYLRHLPPGAGPNAPPDKLPDAPRLQAAPQDERAAYFDEKNRLLNTYGWVDRRNGVAHIPIEAAMDILASRPAAAAKGNPP